MGGPRGGSHGVDAVGGQGRGGAKGGGYDRTFGKKLFVGGIPPWVETGAMKAYFLKFGDISDCVVMKDGAGKSRGFGFVQYTRKEGAARCIQAAGTHVLDGKKVDVKPVDKAEQKPPEKESVSPVRRSRSRSSPSIFRNRGRRKSPSPVAKARGGARSVSRGRSEGARRHSSSSSREGGRRKRRQRSGSSSAPRRKEATSAGAEVSTAARGGGWGGAADEEDDEEVEVDILAERADQRRANAGALSAIDDLPVTRTPEGLPEPIASWSDAVSRRYLNESLKGKLQAAGLERPTLIQRHALPVIAHESGHHDLIASAQTGSGKTFAFVIPTVARLVIQGGVPRPFFPGEMGQASPPVLMLSPTRELAMQTCKEIEVLTRGTALVNMCVFGGESLKVQQQRLSKANVDIMCATPGRLVDLIDCNKVSLSFVQTVVFDEADQMMERGLEAACAEVLMGRDMPPPNSGRQTLMFSATMPAKIRDMVPKILREARIANVRIGHYQDDQGGACANIRQIIRFVPEEERFRAIMEDLQTLWIKPGVATGHRGQVVVFTNARAQANTLSNQLGRQGVSCLHLHGKLEQHVREEVVEKFRRGQTEVLVATNVAARGLDFPDIRLVVQFGMPRDFDSYTHRIGRTGRVGKVGCALAYFGPRDFHMADGLVNFLELNKQEVPPFLLRRGGSGGPRGGRGSGRGASPSRRSARSRSRRR